MLNKRTVVPLGILLLCAWILFRGEHSLHEKLFLASGILLCLWLLRDALIRCFRLLHEPSKGLFGNIKAAAEAPYCEVRLKERCGNLADFMLPVAVCIYDDKKLHSYPPSGMIRCCKQHHPNRKADEIKDELGEKWFETEEMLRERNMRWTQVVLIPRVRL